MLPFGTGIRQQSSPCPTARHNSAMHPIAPSTPLINLASCVQVMCYRRAAGDVGCSAFLGGMKTLFCLFVIIYSASVVCLAQNGFATVKADANACELNSLHFDMIRNELANLPTARITAKFYAGKNENNVVSKKRVAYVRKFLEQSKGFDPSRLEFVNSGRLDTNENPKIEFYIVKPGEAEGKLSLVTYARPNKTPCLDCCEDERVFPKYIGNKPKKKVRKQRKSAKQ